MTLTSLLADQTLGRFLTTTEVTAVRRLTANFTEVELSTPGWDGSSWSPGHKLQMRPQAGTFGLRTYTPMDWDSGDSSTGAGRGSTRLLAYSHGDGPGALWFRSVEVGLTCEVFGPRKSLDLAGLAERTVLVGDETSIGLAVALHRSRPGLAVSHVFEANDVAEVAAVLAHYDLSATSTIVPKADDSADDRADDRAAVIAAVEPAIGTDRPFDLALSGDAATVAAVRRWLRDSGHSPATTKVKAYWAEGRTGLD